jgi:hypothetical protein
MRRGMRPLFAASTPRPEAREQRHSTFLMQIVVTERTNIDKGAHRHGRFFAAGYVALPNDGDVVHWSAVGAEAPPMALECAIANTTIASISPSEAES